MKRITSTREMKRSSYRILNRYHDFEKRKNKSKILTKKMGNELCALLALDHLRTLTIEVLSQIETSDNKFSLPQKYINAFKNFVKEVDQNCSSVKPLKKKRVASILRMHTRTYNWMLIQGIKLSFSEQQGEQWSKAILSAIMVWDQSI